MIWSCLEREKGPRSVYLDMIKETMGAAGLKRDNTSNRDRMSLPAVMTPNRKIYTEVKNLTKDEKWAYEIELKTIEWQYQKICTVL